MVTTVEDIKEQDDFVKTIMVKGMEFAVLESEDDKVYRVIDYDGKVYDKTLIDVYPSGNLTLAMTIDGFEVMVDDDGIHYDW